jgi:hypothetical protein
VRRAAERFQVSPTTASREACRYRVQGATGMVDRSSRPLHSSVPFSVVAAIETISKQMWTDFESVAEFLPRE